VTNLVFTGSRDPKLIAETVNMYDDRILQMDDYMKRILSAFRRKGYLKDYLAVFTADHGQLLGEKGKYCHGFYAMRGDMQIPLVFFSSKPLPPLAQSHFAIQMDITPTLVELAGLDPPSSWQGQSLLREKASQWSYSFSVQQWRGREGAVIYFNRGKNKPDTILKYTRPIGESGDDPGSLYDLEKDPQEKRNLVYAYKTDLLNEIRSKTHEHFPPD
jgi:arylsulfatase A-like enzyme